MILFLPAEAVAGRDWFDQKRLGYQTKTKGGTRGKKPMFIGRDRLKRRLTV